MNQRQTVNIGTIWLRAAEQAPESTRADIKVLLNLISDLVEADDVGRAEISTRLIWNHSTPTGASSSTNTNESPDLSGTGASPQAQSPNISQTGTPISSPPNPGTSTGLAGKSETLTKDSSYSRALNLMGKIAAEAAEVASLAWDRVAELTVKNDRLMLERERLAEENATLKQAVFEHEKGGKV